MLSVSVIGAAGYTGGELLRLLLHHPFVDKVEAVSSSQHGQPLWKIHPDLFGSDLHFTEAPSATDLWLLALPHGASVSFLEKHAAQLPKKIIDLSRDFRLQENQKWSGNTFVYGLSEWNKSSIQSCSYLANPGCFATAIELAIMPLVKANFIDGDVQVFGITGSTGAGVMPSEHTHFSKRFGNHSTYQAFSHPHMDEILESTGFSGDLHFIPGRGAFARGIHVTCLMKSNASQSVIEECFEKAYSSGVFVKHVPFALELKQVVNTNKCYLSTRKNGAVLKVEAIIDNLLKGASGQAVQNMNLMYGFPEDSGLQLKSVVY
jgi:N-acetyl-gamma-glutamyl-phosphate reductase